MKSGERACSSPLVAAAGSPPPPPLCRKLSPGALERKIIGSGHAKFIVVELSADSLTLTPRVRNLSLLHEQKKLRLRCLFLVGKKRVEKTLRVLNLCLAKKNTLRTKFYRWLKKSPWTTKPRSLVEETLRGQSLSLVLTWRTKTLGGQKLFLTLTRSFKHNTYLWSKVKATITFDSSTLLRQDFKKFHSNKKLYSNMKVSFPFENTPYSSRTQRYPPNYFTIHNTKIFQSINNTQKPPLHRTPQVLPKVPRNPNPPTQTQIPASS